MENNPTFDMQGCRQIQRKLSAPSFTLTLKIWKEYTRAIGIQSKQGNGGGTFAHIDISIDFYTWVFPDRRYQLIKMISGKVAFFESIKKELDEHRQKVSAVSEYLINENETSLSELAK